MQKIINFLGSKWVFGATTLIFAAETIWLAITSRFPMAFDEAYHLGLIRFFSHHWNPIITSQPPSSYRFGAIIQNPSWLYHYLMSFPYRLIGLFTHDLAIQVIGLRLIDVVLMIINLFILKKLLRLVRVSDAFINVVLLIFALTPMVTVLSAQISYDDLLILLTTLSMYEALLVIRELGQRSFNVQRFLSLLCLCVLASLVKFAFLPVFVAIAVIVTWKFIACWRADRVRLLNQAASGFTKSSRLIQIVLVVSTVLCLGLFGWFYGRNIIKYHNPVPQCNQVLNKQDCLQYYSWSINYKVQQYSRTHPSADLHLNIFGFTFINWMFYMSEQLYGAIYPIKGLYYISLPLYMLVLYLFIVSVACLVIKLSRIAKSHPELVTLLFISFVYLLFLWGRNYWDYRQLGLPTAISGRYLVPVLAYLYVALGLSISYVLGRSRISRAAKVGLAMAAIIFFVIFGGFSQYVTQITPKYGHLSNANRFVLEFVD